MKTKQKAEIKLESISCHLNTLAKRLSMSFQNHKSNLTSYLLVATRRKCLA